MDLIKGLLLTDKTVGLELVTDYVLFMEEDVITIVDKTLVNVADIIPINQYNPKDKLLLYNLRELLLVSVLIKHFRSLGNSEHIRLSTQDKQFISFYCKSHRLTSTLLPISDINSLCRYDVDLYYQKVGATLNLYDGITKINKGYIKIFYLTLCGMTKSKIIELCSNHFMFSDLDIERCFNIDVSIL